MASRSLAPSACLIPAGLLALASCGGGRGMPPAPGPPVDLSKAVAGALAERPGRAVEAKMKTKHGIVTFEVDVLGADGSVGEVELAADGTPERGLPWERGEAPKPDPELAAVVPALAVDLQAALATALRATPGTARSVELSEVWSAAGGEVKVELDARTGQVLP
jgi:uncharacterized membrane protein YkoI